MLDVHAQLLEQADAVHLVAVVVAAFFRTSAGQDDWQRAVGDGRAERLDTERVFGVALGAGEVRINAQLDDVGAGVPGGLRIGERGRGVVHHDGHADQSRHVRARSPGTARHQTAQD